MSTDPYRWHYDYIRLAWDMGFSFESHKSQKNFDRNGIAVLDIDRIIHDRDISIVEHHIQNILEYSLDIEEARILDPNFVKLFRLSQLAVEYLMYCKKYLDNTVVVIKNDLQKSNEENNELKQAIMNYQLEVSKMKKKNKDLKTALQIHEKYQPIGTVNVPLAHFQCKECGKVFIHEDYLKAHIIRRHAPQDIQQLSEIKTDLPHSEEQINTTPVHSLYKAETDRLQMEIKELKEKLNNTERYFQSEEQNKKVDRDSKIRDLEIHNEDYYKHIEKLHQQFDILKTQVESELQVLKVQKSEQDKYDKWIEKVFDKFNEKPALTQLVEKKTEDDGNEPKIVEVKSKDKETNPDVSEKETDDVQEQREDEIDNEFEQNNDEKVEVTIVNELSKITLKPSPQKQSAPRLSEGATTFSKTSESPSKSEKSWTDISKVKEQVEKELEEKTKHDFEKLGVQLSEQMTNTFSKLQDRLEIFWDKLQEIEDKHEKHRILLKTVDLIKTTNTFQMPEKITVSTKSIQNSSDYDSDTESIKAEKQNTEKIKPVSIRAQIHNDAKYAKNLIDELKSKVQEKKKEPSRINSKEPKIEKIKTIQPQPSIREIYSRKMIVQSDSESESETSESDTEETESPAIMKPSKTVTNSAVTVNRPKNASTEAVKSSHTGVTTLQKRSIRSLENALITNPEILESFREDIEDVVSNRLRDIGVDPEWTRLPEKSYKQKMDIVTHHRTMASKNIKSFSDIRNKIIDKLEGKMQHFKPTASTSVTPEPELRPSKFRSLISNMKNRAKSIIKTENKPVHQVSGIYKLTIHQNLPQSQKSEPEKHSEIVKQKTTNSVNKNVPKAKPRERVRQRMYKSESDTETLTENLANESPTKTKKLQKKSLRKTKSDSSLDVVDIESNHENQTKPVNIPETVKNIGQSFDSILEMKQELSAAQQRVSDKSESSSYENILSPKRSLPKIDQPAENFIQKTIEIEKSQLKISSSDFESDEFREEKMQKGVLKNYASTGAKKKVLFDLHSEDVKTNSEENIVQDELSETKTVQKIPVKKTLVKSNTFLQSDIHGSSTSIDSSILDFNKKSGKQIHKASGDKISTQALINVSAKQNKTEHDISDWDISDIN